jgi:hypothetical protein
MRCVGSDEVASTESTCEEEDEENGVIGSSSREPWLAHSVRHGSGWGRAAEAGSSDLLGPAAHGSNHLLPRRNTTQLLSMNHLAFNE